MNIFAKSGKNTNTKNNLKSPEKSSIVKINLESSTKGAERYTSTNKRTSLLKRDIKIHKTN